jgi:endoglycosylceramidase
VARHLPIAALIPVLLAAGCIGRSDPAATSNQTRPSPQTVDPARPWVTTEGGRFADRSGSTVVLRGVDVHTLDPAVYSVAPELGVNFMRVTVPWSDYELSAPVGGVRRWNLSRLRELDALVVFCREHGITVLLDLHQYGWSPYFARLRPGGRANGIPAWFYARRGVPITEAGLAEAEARFYNDHRATRLYSGFARMVATRYRTSPNVLGYEILNEPPTGTLPDTHWATQIVVAWQSRILRAIRSVDSGRTVVFMLRGGPSLGAQAADLSTFGSLRHLALDVHDYFAGTGGSGYTPDGEALSRYRTTLQGGAYRGAPGSQAAALAVPLAASRRWHIPLIVGEWGAFAGTPGLARYQRQMVALFQAFGVSSARWSLGGGEPLGLLNRDLTPKPAALQLRRLLGR